MHDRVASHRRRLSLSYHRLAILLPLLIAWPYCARSEEKAEETAPAGSYTAGRITDTEDKPIAGASIEWGLYDDPVEKA